MEWMGGSVPVVENTRESESVNEETIRRMIEKMAKKSEKERKFSVMELVSMLVVCSRIKTVGRWCG